MTPADPRPEIGVVVEISVVVATRDRAHLLPRLLGALAAQELGGGRFEVVVVDDGSTDATPRVLAALAATSPLRLRVLRQERPTGPAAARNLGWRSTTAPLVAFTDDDCVPEPGWLVALAARLVARPAVGVVQGRTTPPAGADHSHEWDVWRLVEGTSPWFEACNIAYRRSALERTGGFDEGLRWFGEDTALGWAVLDAGWERDYVDDAVVVHDVERRGMRWHLANARHHDHLVTVAARHPAFRHAAFARPWALHEHDHLVLLAAAGVVGALAARRPWPLLLGLPWLRARRPGLRQPEAVKLLAGRAAIDATSSAALLRGSVRNRTLVV